MSSTVEEIVTCLYNSLVFINTAVEFMDDASVAVVEKHLDLHNPLTSHPFYTLVETSGSHDQHDKEVNHGTGGITSPCDVYTSSVNTLQKLDRFLDHVMTRGLIGDGTVAPDISKVI